MQRFIIPLLLLLTVILVPVAAASEYMNQSLVSVGQGFVVCDADLGIVSLAIENTATDASLVHTKNMQVVQRIVKALQEAKLPGLEITIRQPSIWLKTSLVSRDVTYTASSGLDIKVSDISLIGRVADIGMRNGATAIQGVRFDASNLQEAKQLALEQAVQDAINKAKVMSATAGLRLVMVREISDTNDIQVHNPSALQAQGVDTKLPVMAEPVYRGQVIVSASVTVVFDVTLDKSHDVLSVNSIAQ